MFIDSSSNNCEGSRRGRNSSFSPELSDVNSLAAFARQKKRCVSLHEIGETHGKIIRKGLFAFAPSL